MLQRQRTFAVMAAFAAVACSSQPPSGSAEPGEVTDTDLEALTSAREPTLLRRAVLPSATFATGPTSGRQLGTTAIHGVVPPFENKQPVQGISALLPAGGGRFYALADNGFGSLENSADFRLRVYTLRPDFRSKRATGGVRVEGFFELADPDHQIPFPIVEAFTAERKLTGADFDVESFQRDTDGTFWFGDELGPFLLHTDAQGRVLEPPIPLPDPDAAGAEVRSPQSPLQEESSFVRVMNAFRHHARVHGNDKAPVASPYHLMIKDGDPATLTGDRETPPPGSGLPSATSEVVDVASLKAAGYPVVPYTVNDVARMEQLVRLGVNGLISDRPDLLVTFAATFDQNGDGVPGDLLDADGLVDRTKLDVQGHRGARDLRPENTLPAFEAALDALVTTLELDTGITKDGVPILDHDPQVQAEKCRRADGRPYEGDEVLLRDKSARELQTTFLCDKVFRGPAQKNDLALSPVTAAFVTEGKIPAAYAMPTLAQLFAFVDHYVVYYTTGPGASSADAAKRAKNAARVRFNIETKVNPRPEYRHRTVDAAPFAEAVASLVARSGLEDRADIQSFDARTLLHVQERYPRIRTVYLFGDFPRYEDASLAGSDDGTNLQPDASGNTPWLAGLRWPYRETSRARPFRAQTSGGFEGMALTKDGRYLLPMLEKPLVGSSERVLEIFAFDLWTHRYVGRRARYALDPRGTNIGDFQMVSAHEGLVIERDGTEGDLTGWKRVFRITLGEPGELVAKEPFLDLLALADPQGISLPGEPGDVGLGKVFSFPFQTIESIVPLGPRTVLLCNDNNYPFSVGRHVGAGVPDDTELIVVDAGRR